MRQRRAISPLEIITDRHAVPEMEQCLTQALAGGARWINLRDRDLPFEERRDWARRLRELTRRFDALLTVSRDETLAEAVDADGLHLTSTQDPAPIRARHPDWLLIASTHNGGEIASAVAGGVDAVTLSPVFATATHPEVAALGIERFAALARECPVPVYALGGIDAGGIVAVLQAGAAGVAMIRGVLGAENSEDEARRVMAILAENGGGN